MKPEIYVSLDIETDGPIPGDYSMLSLGAAAFDESGRLIDTFSANLLPLPGATQSVETMAWWAKHPEAWAAATQSAQEPRDVMMRFVAWLDGLPARPIAVAYPATFDFGFVHWYLHHFVGRDPFGFAALDLKTYAMARMGCRFREAAKKKMPKEWLAGKHDHSHIAIEDALEQGKLWLNMRRQKGGKDV